MWRVQAKNLTTGILNYPTSYVAITVASFIIDFFSSSKVLELFYCLFIASFSTAAKTLLEDKILDLNYVPFLPFILTPPSVSAHLTSEKYVRGRILSKLEFYGVGISIFSFKINFWRP